MWKVLVTMIVTLSPPPSISLSGCQFPDEWQERVNTESIGLIWLKAKVIVVHVSYVQIARWCGVEPN